MNAPARLYSAELEGIDAKIIEVEADIHAGLHAFNIVGLADKSLNEAKERVNSALKNSNIKPPNRENRKITINLAPADVKKNGSHYDLAIALSYLIATKQIKSFDGSRIIFLGELALDGRLRRASGTLNIAEKAARRGFEKIFLPEENAYEASVIKEIAVIPIKDFKETIDILEGVAAPRNIAARKTRDTINLAPDFSEIKGQENAKRALLIAAAGGHNALLIGPPGVGKSFLARALAGILPKLNREEAIEVTKIWSAARMNVSALIEERPFRAPHQTASAVSLTGGGNDPKPGEISLAHRGILFLDEVPEFQKNVLEALRQPMETGAVHVARAKQSLIFPARFTLIAAMNPCPCGYYGESDKECRCSAYEVIKYQKKISGPLLDRIDLQVRVKRVDIRELQINEGEIAINTSLRERVEQVRNIQMRRLLGSGAKTNSEMSSKEIGRFANLDEEAGRFIQSIDKNRLSPRGYYKLLKTARTIADLEEKEKITSEHIAEAFSYRLKEEY